MPASPRRPRASAVLAAALAVSAIVAAGVVAPASADVHVTTVPASRYVEFAGHAWGHGHGLSQEGAAGAARVAGLSARKIAAFYYPHTDGADIGNPVIRVLLSAVPGDRLVVGRTDGLAFRDVATKKKATVLPDGPKKWRVRVTGAKVALEKWLRGKWRAHELDGRSTFAGPVRFVVKDSTKPSMRVLLPDGSERDYRGYLSARTTSTHALLSMAVMPMEDYLRGVVPRESPSSWPQGALRAQAIAARSYAEYEREHAGSRHYDICDSTQCQVFGGSTLVTASGTSFDLEPASTDTAVRKTAGHIRAYKGDAIFAQYSASNGGWSTAGGTPYLIAQRDPYDGLTGSSSHAWTARIPASVFEARWPAIGRLKRIVVTARDGHGAWGGRALTVKLRGTKDSVTVTGSDIQHAYEWPAHSDGLRSSWWEVVDVPSDVNGDGVSDVVTGLPGRATGGHPGAGAVAVLPGEGGGVAATGGELVTQSSRGVQGTPEDADHFGSVVTTGDFDGDGRADVAVGAPGEDLKAATDAGVVQVLRGGPNGVRNRDVTMLRENKLTGPGSAVAGERFGTSLVAGDFNGDGYADLAVGVPKESVDGQEHAGRVYVVPGSAGGLDVDAAIAMSASTPKVPGTAEKGDRFGAALAAGDVTGDGRDELAVGAPGDRDGEKGSGMVTVFDGDGQKFVDRDGRLVAGSRVGNAPKFGRALAIGDTDDNGHADVVVGGRGTGSGAFTVLPGTDSGVDPAGAVTIDEATDGVPGKAEPGDGFAAALATGDVDGDGRVDVIVGSPGESQDSLDRAGGITVVYGAWHGITGKRAAFFSRSTKGVAGRPAAGDALGATVMVLDLDGDRVGDVLSGAPGSRDGEGSLTALAGSEGRLTAAGSRVIRADDAGTTAPAARDRFGAALPDL